MRTARHGPGRNRLLEPGIERVNGGGVLRLAQRTAGWIILSRYLEEATAQVNAFVAY